MAKKATSRLILMLSLSFFPIAGFAQSNVDVLVLGDSQISFGAGAAYLDFFKNINHFCDDSDLKHKQQSKLGDRHTLAVGVRSTSLHSWVARSGKPKDTICEVDKKYGVNAGAYGIGGRSERKFIQIGKERGFKYCKPNKSPFEAVFNDPASRPKLLVLNFLGNAEKRWSENKDDVAIDVSRTLQQIPKDVPCVILTTAPVFLKTTNDKRMRAQTHLTEALETSGGRCKIVKGLTPETRKAIEGKSHFFRRNKKGQVSDPHHPNNAATRQFVKLTAPQLCNAIASVLK